jgi:hypothetical protein
MDPISIGLCCITGVVIYNNINLTYNMLNHKPKIYKVEDYILDNNMDNELNEEFDSMYNQLYKKKSNKYILVEENQNKYFNFFLSKNR